ncbi:SMI1/KNR4 family protein [Streptomyces sp. NPDC006332]|uniref:SMI1/KNR4 family protein n=1 Tax=Streptomyces sp. NPDC006332 TaxID=3155456 RepID=UPI0033B2CE56
MSHAPYDTAQLWERLERWLFEHVPDEYASLRAGAAEANISQLEEGLGFPLHPDLKVLLARHDGVTAPLGSTDPGMFLMNYALLDTRRILEQQRHLASMAADAVEEGDEDLVVGRIAHGGWVPFAQSFSGDMLFVDHRRGAHYGEVGEMSFGDPDYRVLWASQELMLEELCAGVENGSPLTSLPRVPSVHEGCKLEWHVFRARR